MGLLKWSTNFDAIQFKLDVLKEKPSKTIKEIKTFPFHGGCFECKQYFIEGVNYCHNCQYFEPDWDKPDLSNRRGIQYHKKSKEIQKYKNVPNSSNKDMKKNTDPIAMDIVSFFVWLDSATIEQLEIFGNG